MAAGHQIYVIRSHCSTEYMKPRRTYLLIEVDFHKLSEATAVVVPDSFRISESLQQRICCGIEERKHMKPQSQTGGTVVFTDTKRESYLPLFSHLYPDRFRTTLSSTCGEINTGDVDCFTLITAM